MRTLAGLIIGVLVVAGCAQPSAGRFPVGVARHLDNPGEGEPDGRVHGPRPRRLGLPTTAAAAAAEKRTRARPAASGGVLNRDRLWLVALLAAAATSRPPGREAGP